MKELKSWENLRDNYSMVLFNEAPNLTRRDDTSNFEGVIMEWLESHECEAEQARQDIEALENSEDKKDIKKRDDLIDEWGENPECNCEPFQWYAIEISEYDVEYLNKEFNLDIFFSEILGIYILPVYHFGTSWSIMGLNGGYVNV